MWFDDLASTYPAFALLPAREQALLDRVQVGFPDSRKLVVATSQSEATVQEGYANTIKPCGHYRLAHRARALLGIEAMHLQAFWLEDDPTTAGDNALLQNLAGNAFNLTCVSSALLTAMAVTARMHHRHYVQSRLPAVAAHVQGALEMLVDSGTESGTDEDLR